MGADGHDGTECYADTIRNGSIMQWLFGWDGSQGIPTVAGAECGTFIIVCDCEADR